MDLDDPTPLGIGHTRWATHGRPTEENAHPHRSADGQVVAVHNGIFENFLELRAELKAAGQAFCTETDTECFPVMVAQILQDRAGLPQGLHPGGGAHAGIYAIACLHACDPGRILVARSGPPLVIGLGDGENFIASDVIPLLRHTRRVIHLEDGDLAEIRADGVEVFRQDGKPVERPVPTIPYDPVAAEKGGFKHFMQKEIFEQSMAVSNTLVERLPVNGGAIPLDLPFTDEELKAVQRIVILACGTSRHAGLVGQFYFEQLARIGVEVDYGSEYRYRDPVVMDRHPGHRHHPERRDRRHPGRHEGGRRPGRPHPGHLQRPGLHRHPPGRRLSSSPTPAPRSASPPPRPSPPSWWRSLLLALRLGELRGTLDPGRAGQLLQALRELPGAAGPGGRAGARDLQVGPEVARGHRLPVPGPRPALPHRPGRRPQAQGDLLHPRRGLPRRGDEARPHRPHRPAPAHRRPHARDAHREKTLSNLQEAAARDGRILALVSDGDTAWTDIAEDVLHLPACNPWLAPILYVVPLQLLAYHIAVIRGCDVDQPRNLAKSVTVE